MINIEEFMKQQGEINNSLVLSSKNTTEMISQIAQEIQSKSINALSRQVDEMKKEFKSMKSNILKMGNKYEGMELEVKHTTEKVINIEDKVDTIEFDDKGQMGELKREAKKRVMYFTGDRTTPDYVLFFRPFIGQLYSHVTHNLNQERRIGKIKTRDFNTALSLTKNWYPDKKYIEKLENDYLNMKTLPFEKKKALEIYLDNKMEGKNVRF